MVLIGDPGSPSHNGQNLEHRNHEGRTVRSVLMSHTQVDAVFAAVLERRRQDEKWGGIHNYDTRDPNKWMTILMKEVRELAEAILERDERGVVEEAVQVAAVALAIHESQHRNPFTER